jgi:hypothetical protein
MAKIKRGPGGKVSLGKNMPWSSRVGGGNRKAMANGLRQAALKSAKGGKTAEQKAARKAKVAAVKQSAKSGGGKRAKRYLARDFVNFNKRTGQFEGYKKGAPKNYVYLPGSRYLTHTKNLGLISSMTSKEQAKFVRDNRKAVEQAIERASRAGDFKDFGLNRKMDGGYAADFNLGGKKSGKFRDRLTDYFGRPNKMHLPRLRPGYGPSSRRARATWSFAFGQDGHVK